MDAELVDDLALDRAGVGDVLAVVGQVVDDREGVDGVGEVDRTVVIYEARRPAAVLALADVDPRDQLVRVLISRGGAGEVEPAS